MSKFGTRFNQSTVDFLDSKYLNENQYPQRREIARAWKSRISHYGNTTTSTLEDNDRNTNDYMHNSKGDLMYMGSRTQNAIKNQIDEHKAVLAKAYDRSNPNADTSIIGCCHSNLHELITNHAMNLFTRRLMIAKSSNINSIYNKIFDTIYGIHCCISIEGFIVSGRKSNLDGRNEHQLSERDDCNYTNDINAVIEER